MRGGEGGGDTFILYFITPLHSPFISKYVKSSTPQFVFLKISIRSSQNVSVDSTSTLLVGHALYFSARLANGLAGRRWVECIRYVLVG